MEHINLNRTIPKQVLDFGFKDGRWLSLTVEGLLPTLLKKVHDSYELRVIGKSGVNCLPSSQKGIGRVEDIRAFKEKSKDVKFFYLVLRTFDNHIQIHRIPASTVRRFKGKLSRKQLKTVLPEETHKWF